MEIINVEAGDSRDTSGRETFHPFVPEHHLIRGYLPKTFWYWNYNYYPAVEVSPEEPGIHFSSASYDVCERVMCELELGDRTQKQNLEFFTY